MLKKGQQNFHEVCAVTNAETLAYEALEYDVNHEEERFLGTDNEEDRLLGTTGRTSDSL